MQLTQTKYNKCSETKWDDYEFYNEPEHHNGYDISPLLEKELLDRSHFLKIRVWHKLNKLKTGFDQQSPPAQPNRGHAGVGGGVFSHAP